MKFTIIVNLNPWGQKLLKNPLIEIPAEMDIDIPENTQAKERYGYQNYFYVSDIDEQTRQSILDIVCKECPKDLLKLDSARVCYIPAPIYKTSDVVLIRIPASYQTCEHEFTALSHIEFINTITGEAQVNIDSIWNDLMPEHKYDLPEKYVRSKTRSVREDIYKDYNHKIFSFDAQTGLDRSNAKTNKWTIEPVTEETAKSYMDSLSRRKKVERELMPMVSFYMDIVYGDKETREDTYRGLDFLFHTKEWAHLMDRIKVGSDLVGDTESVAEKIKFCENYKTLAEFHESEVECKIAQKA